MDSRTIEYQRALHNVVTRMLATAITDRTSLGAFKYLLIFLEYCPSRDCLEWANTLKRHIATAFPEEYNNAMLELMRSFDLEWAKVSGKRI